MEGQIPSTEDVRPQVEPDRDRSGQARPVAQNSWAGTLTYDGASYTGTVSLENPETLRVQSCSGIFCRTFMLKRL